MLNSRVLKSLSSISLKQISLRQYYSQNGQKVFRVESKLQNQILSLEEFMIERQKNKPITLFQNRNQEIFKFGINPLVLRNRLFIFLKYNYWQKNSYGEDRFIQFCKKLQEEQLELREIEQNKKDQQYFKRLNLVREYHKQIVSLSLVVVRQQLQFLEQYILILSRFLNQVQQLTQYQMYFIFDNYEKIVVGQLIQKQEQDTKDIGWLLIQSFDKFVNKIDCYLNNLSPHYKSLLIFLAKCLRSNNVRLLQYVKIVLQNDKKQLTMYYFLSGLCLLAINNTFPFEYFYKNKKEIMTYLQSAQNLSEKKVLNMINMLQIFSRIRLMFCQNIINRLLVCIEQNLIACDLTQVSKIFFYYSKLKCSIKHNLVVKLVQRIYTFIDNLDEKAYSFIIKAISNLNYHDNMLIQTLKNYNYELFLSIIKYNSENSGDFYRKIIEQVQRAFKSDNQRYFTPEDQIFIQKSLLQSASDGIEKDKIQNSINLKVSV